VIPLPEAADYQIRVREKRQRERDDRSRQGRIKIDLTLGGTLDSEQYCAAADGLVIGTRRPFRSKEWFCQDDQLMQHDGQTWCLRKYWGKHTPKALRNLIDLAQELKLPDADSMEFQLHGD
jgi:hypothetical protein